LSIWLLLIYSHYKYWMKNIILSVEIIICSINFS